MPNKQAASASRDQSRLETPWKCSLSLLKAAVPHGSSDLGSDGSTVPFAHLTGENAPQHPVLPVTLQGPPPKCSLLIQYKLICANKCLLRLQHWRSFCLMVGCLPHRGVWTGPWVDSGRARFQSLISHPHRKIGALIK